ncbi:MAG: LysM peptidoglycan-binding domain-containing protein [Chloroflexota bacterium]|nr:LysM peptidoglycan-binding domain-containing protein [Chloroflexota bacterium]
MANRRRRIAPLAIVLVILLSAVPVGSGPMAAVGDALYNGGFEHGFEANQACGGMVGAGWGCFQNGGTAAYGFYDDMWDPVVYAGEHSQLIEINTKEMGGDNDRNAGIYQTAGVWPGTQYELSLKGMIRAEDNGGDPWRYRVYVGFDYYGGTDWQAVTDWRELPWDSYYDRLSPGEFSSYNTTVTPITKRLTVFVRVQRKWGTWYEETDVNLDAISLFGPVRVENYKPKPVHPPVAKPPVWHPPVVEPPIAHPPVAKPPVWHPPVKPPVHPGWGVHPPKPRPEPTIVCDGPNLLMNGGFEYGFQANGVANYWMGFNNGGRANYGYYDEQWPPVVSEGKHGQLIEINTLDVGDQTDPDRMSGIYQWLWLKPGATYEFSVDAMMRERNDHSDEDFYRYMVEWGYSANGWTDPANMTFRERVPLDNIYLRTEPGEMQSYTTRFAAPSETTTIWLFALKKWATLERELDANLDNVAIRICRKAYPMYPVHPPKPMPPVVYPPYPKPPVNPVPPSKPKPPIASCSDPGNVQYWVQPGDTLSGLAQQFGTTVAEIMVKNGLSNPNYIYVGQELCIPTQPVPEPYEPPTAEAPQPLPAPVTQTEQVPSTEIEVIQEAEASPFATEEAPGPTESPPAAAPAAVPPAQEEVERIGVTETYQIRRGDTLSRIAQNNGTTVEALVALNDIENPNWIYAGMVLEVSVR